jgi:uncharacterized membrane protein
LAGGASAGRRYGAAAPSLFGREMRTTVWVAVIFLVLIGLASVIGRVIFPRDFAHRAELTRNRFIDSRPHTEEELAEVDNKFGGQRAITLVHIVAGGLFLLLAPLQFVPAIRNRYLRMHRRMGRVLIIVALISGAAGLFFGLYRPIAGVREAVGIALFGVFLFIAAIKGYVAIRNGQVELHREWMIRAFATALAISTVRVAAAVIDIGQIVANNPRTQFVLSIWSGWLITLALAEIWIRYSRGRFSSDSFSSLRQQSPSRIPVPESPLISEDGSSF